MKGEERNQPRILLPVVLDGAKYEYGYVSQQRLSFLSKNSWRRKRVETLQQESI